MGFLKNTLVTASVATVGTTLASAFLGRLETGSFAAPINATSHIVWDDEAFSQDGLSTRYSLVGAAINAAAMLGWAALQEVALGRWVRKGSVARAVAAGAATSAVAYATDYHVVPERLTPRFERRLSRGSLALVYGVLAIGMAVGVRRGEA